MSTPIACNRGRWEAGLDKRLRFFDRDTIDFSDVKYEQFYTQLLDLKHRNAALFNGDYGGQLTILDDGNSNVSSFIRSSESNRVTVIVNLSGEEQQVKFNTDEVGVSLQDIFSDEVMDLGSDQWVTLAPYQYLVDVKNTSNE